MAFSHSSDPCFCVECMEPAGTGKTRCFRIHFVRDGEGGLGPELYGDAGFAEECRRDILRASGVSEATVLWMPEPVVVAAEQAA